MSYPIIPLPKADWQGAILPIGYTTWEYYDVAMQREHDGFSISIQKRQLESPIPAHPAGTRLPRPAVCRALASGAGLGHRGGGAA